AHAGRSHAPHPHAACARHAPEAAGSTRAEAAGADGVHHAAALAPAVRILVLDALLIGDLALLRDLLIGRANALVAGDAERGVERAVVVRTDPRGAVVADLALVEASLL